LQALFIGRATAKANAIRGVLFLEALRRCAHMSEIHWINQALNLVLIIMGRFAYFLAFFALQLNSEFSSDFILFDKPRCGGLLIRRDAILTLQKCVQNNTKLISPIQKAPISAIKIMGSELMIVFFNKPLPGKGFNVPEYPNPLIQQEQVIVFGNNHESTGSLIDKITDQYIWASNDKGWFSFFNWRDNQEAPQLYGSPMLAQIPGSTQTLRPIGIMLDTYQAIRIDTYSQSILEILTEHPFVETSESIYVPVVVVRNETPLLIIEAQNLPADKPSSTSNTPEPQVDPPIKSDLAEIEPIAQLPPESLGCVCSQIRRR